MAALAALIWDIVSDGGSRLSWSFLVNIASRNAADAGVYHALMGSIWVVALTGLLALPVGVGAAIYLEEYGSRSRISRFIELNILRDSEFLCRKNTFCFPSRYLPH